MLVLKSNLESSFLVEKTVFMADHETRQDFTLMNQQGRILDIGGQVENESG